MKMMNNSRIVDRPERPPVRGAEPHVALSLVLDVSSSMDGVPIDMLNKAVNKMIEQMKEDERLSEIVDLGIFIFGNHEKENIIYQGFRPIASCEPIDIKANDTNTYVVNTLERAVEFSRKRVLAYNNLSGAYKPWIILMTDGEFHDGVAELKAIGNKIKEREAAGKLHFFGLGVEGYDRLQLEHMTNNSDRIINIKAANFEEFFSWVGHSMAEISWKGVDEPVVLKPIRFSM